MIDIQVSAVLNEDPIWLGIGDVTLHCLRDFEQRHGIESIVGKAQDHGGIAAESSCCRLRRSMQL